MLARREGPDLDVLSRAGRVAGVLLVGLMALAGQRELAAAHDLDRNADGLTSITELWPLSGSVLRAPLSLLLAGVSSVAPEGLLAFLEFGSASAWLLGSAAGGVLGLVLWWLVWAALLGLELAVVDLVRRLAGTGR